MTTVAGGRDPNGRGCRATVLAFTIAAGTLIGVATQAWADPTEPPRAAPPLARLSQDAGVAELLGGLAKQAPYGQIEFDDVQVVDPAAGTVTPGQDVLVIGARIAWVGDAGKAPRLSGVTHVQGGGHFLAPGLADMHVHSSRADGWLLDLAAGVTTVRDMDGFPWILKARDQINAGRMLGPTDYVAGTILATLPLDGYAVVAAGPEDARRLVRQQAACGYNFIKVHNAMRQPVFDAVADQAARLGMDLVGHVPHDISLDHALHVGRMRTTEHLKGFLIDRTLLPSDEDYAAALNGAETWVTPTLYTRRGYDRGRWARGILDGPLAAYAPPDVRRDWAELLAHPDPQDVKTGDLLASTQAKVMARLLPLKPHWLAGTDAAGYPFNLSGYALLDELQLLQDAGLTPAQALAAATTEAAAAMHESEEFGTIAKGRRADLVLLDRNPLQAPSAYGASLGVMAHGHWLNRAELDKALADLAALYRDDAGTPSPTPASVTALVERLKRAQAAGFVFDDMELGTLAADLDKLGLGAQARTVAALEVSPRDGPCAETLP